MCKVWRHLPVPQGGRPDSQTAGLLQGSWQAAAWLEHWQLPCNWVGGLRVWLACRHSCVWLASRALVGRSLLQSKLCTRTTQHVS